MKKPKKLYRFNMHHELEVHEIHDDCVPQVVKHNGYGVLWRCRHGGFAEPGRHGDHSGYAKRQEAKEEAIINVRVHMSELRALYQKLTGKVLTE